MTGLQCTVQLALFCFCIGWAAWRWYRRWPARPNPVVITVLWVTVGFGTWMLILDLARLGWPLWLMAPMLGAALCAGIAARRVTAPAFRTPTRWVVLAAGVLGSQAALVALSPTAGWDFRYIWGLKARVFAIANSSDTLWLAWWPNIDHHPDYPPLWPDIMALGPLMGGSVVAAATFWQVLLLAGLSAACWDNLRGHHALFRFLGAALGGFAPVILAPAYWGYADLLVAFLASVAFGSLARLCQRADYDASATASLAVAVVGLCLTKYEGMLLAFGLVVAVLAFGRGTARILVPGAFAASAGCWQLFLWLHRVPREPRTFDPVAWLVSGREMLRWLLQQPWLPIGLLLAAWALVLASLARRRTAAVAIAVTVWWMGAIAAYLTSLQGTVWHLQTSFDRVIAAPLPGAVSVALACALATLKETAAKSLAATT